MTNALILNIYKQHNIIAVKPSWILQFNKGEHKTSIDLIWPGIASLDVESKKRIHNNHAGSIIGERNVFDHKKLKLTLFS